MKLLSRSALVISIAAAGLVATTGLAAAGPGQGCMFSKLGTPDVTASGDGPGGLLIASPDANALGAALGGLGAIAALLGGGTLLVRQRRLARVAAANAAALAAEADLGVATAAQTVVAPGAGEAETEVALASRR